MAAGKPVKPVGITVGTGYTCDFEFGFEFNRFPVKPDSKPLQEGGGLTGPVGIINPGTARPHPAPCAPCRPV